MSKNAWNKKPDVTPYTHFRASMFSTRHFGLYPAAEMDPWLNELKAEYDTLKEKAEKWDQFLSECEQKWFQGYDQLKQKLDAIKKWWESNANRRGTTPTEEWLRLNKILEEKQ